MSGLFSLLKQSGGELARKNADALLEVNSVTSQYGLSLTREDAELLLETRERALQETERVEPGDGILDKLILAFCDSPYLGSENYADLLCALTELFYYMKGETLEQMPDDELIERMKGYFDGVDQGSLDLLASRELDQMARNIRAYGTPDSPEDAEPAEVAEDSGEYPIEEDETWRTLQL